MGNKRNPSVTSLHPAKKSTDHSTIFDDVFRTIAQKMPQLLIPLINEVFQTHYSENEHFEQLLNDFREINQQLANTCQTEQKSELYLNMMALIDQIADYIIPVDHTIRKGLGKVMGGQILQLESERLKAEGQLEGRCEAIQNMIKYNVPKETILQDYTPEEYEKALKTMPVKI